jgi:YidC/Oxa1 family membrane protein insertase
MWSAFFTTLIYEPIYNALALFVSWSPYGDVGLAIILITVVVKLILFPLAVTASHTQIAMRALEPQLKEIRDAHKDNSQEMALKTLALYRENKVNPFASILILIIQLPVILGLYWVIWKESSTGVFDEAYLYSWVSQPDVSSFMFLNLIPLAQGSILLAVLAGVTQYYLSRLMLPTFPVETGKQFQDDLAKSMHLQMRYVFPVLLGVIAYVATAAIALYFITSNIFGIMQEFAARKRHHTTHGH